MDTDWLVGIGVSLDREAEVPVGLQLTWALRSAIRGGQLAPGQRLPPARELSEAVGVNVNTLRTVIGRLETEGYLDARHGTGTFVTANPPQRTNLSALVDDVARAAQHAGVDPRDLAGALYTADIPPATKDSNMGERRELRQQIAVLDRLHTELAIRAGQGLPSLSCRTTRPPQPRLLSHAELCVQRDALLDDIARLRQEPTKEPPKPAPAAQAAPQPVRRPAATRPRIQPA